MGIKFTQVPADTFQKIQLNAGILLDAFNPATGVIGNILGATSGGVNFSSNPEYTDFGEDVDNVPANSLQLKKLKAFDPTMSGTFLTVTAAVVKMLVAAADIDAGDATRVIPRAYLESGDFKEIWWVGDYSDNNTGDNAGFIAIHMSNALNTAGFQIQSGKDAKGTFAFEFHGHYDIENMDKVPFEVYVKAGTSTATPSVNLNAHNINVAVGDTVQLYATVIPAGSTVTWSSSATGKATVSNGVVTGVSAGSAIITAAITVDGVTYNDTCTAVVTS